MESYLLGELGYIRLMLSFGCLAATTGEKKDKKLAKISVHAGLRFIGCRRIIGFATRATRAMRYSNGPWRIHTYY